MFRTLDRYVVRQVVSPFTIVLLIFSFVLLMPPMIEVADRFVAKGVAWSVILRMLYTLVPQSLSVSIPMALLVGLLIGLGRLSEDREWVALQACGVSAYRILQPVGVLAVAAWAVCSYVIIVAVPDANQAYREIAYSVLASRVQSEVKPNVFFEDFPGIVLYVREVKPGRRGWFDVFVADTRDQAAPTVFVSRYGEMVLDRQKRTVDMVLEDGYRHSDTPDGYQVQRFDRLSFGLDAEVVFPSSGPARGDMELRIPELRAKAEELRRAGQSPHPPLLALHQKLSIPFACFVFALMAVGLGLSNRKDGKMASFTIGLGVIFLYYIVMYAGQAMVKGRLMTPWFGAWLPNMVLGPLAVLLLLWRTRAAEGGVRIPFLSRDRGCAAAVPSPGRPTAKPHWRRVVVVVRVPRVSLPGPGLLDRYVGRAYLRVFGLAFFGLLTLFYIATFIDLSERLFKGTATVRMLLQYMAFTTPQYVYFVIPISALVSTLVTIGLLTRNSELVVMKACGISLYRAAVPMLVFAVMWSGLIFMIAESVMPMANREAQQLRHVMVGGAPRTFDVLSRRWVVGKDGRIYNYVYFNPRTNELNNLSVYEVDRESWRLEQRTFVRVAKHAPRPGSAGMAVWRARDGWTRQFAVSRTGPEEDGREIIAYAPFNESDVPLEPPEHFGTEVPDAERMNYVVLRKYINDLRAGGFDVVPYMVALHRKIAFPFVSLVMTLLGVPFAVTTGRRGAMYGIGLGIMLAMIYWVTSQVFGAMGSGGLIVPLLAAWAPNLLFGAGAAYLLLTVRT
ncbi:MAG: LPS export ABC transporter permease LptG [Vicinamibacterales bacterium]